MKGVVRETGDDNDSSNASDNENIPFRVGTKVLGYFKSGKGVAKPCTRLFGYFS